MTEIILPAMGEGIIDATITKILKQVGDSVEIDEPIFEVATDKVDSEIVSPIDGVIAEIRCAEGDVVEIEKLIAIVIQEGEKRSDSKHNKVEFKKAIVEPTIKESKKEVERTLEKKSDIIESEVFLSPLVKNIVKKEKITNQELTHIKGSGLNNRITKDDIFSFLEQRKETKVSNNSVQNQKSTDSGLIGENVEIVEMDRMRTLIADHMISSKKTSAHVSSFVEVDMTPIVKWRESIKDKFFAREAEKITYMPIFIEAVVKAIKDFPGVNVSVDGNKIIYKKNINIGMAAALPSGNLIVPVIKNADTYSLLGLTKEVNDLANRSRINKLLPNEINGGTFTITNMGTFGNITGTPIINQPQVAILAVGAIKKKPAVIETPEGDFIGIRHIMIMALSYDHRVVDGAMGGMFLKRIADNLENFNTKTNI